MSCEQYFLEKLRERGFRLTQQREMVLSAMHGLDQFATADEVLARVRQRSTSVDISTVYRTLDLLQDLHLVTTVDPGDGRRLYELLGFDEPHLHLVCSRCGHVRGIGLGEVQGLIEDLREIYGFAVNVECLSRSGVCAECQAGLEN